MINIDYLTLKSFFEENIDFFIGARLQKIQQPSRRDFVFSLRNNGESRKFYININPQVYHVVFMTNDLRGIEFPKKPPMFCMQLRKYLEGCRINDALVVENERILEFHFDIMDELSQKRSLCLAIELMGKHSNVILYDRETSIIIGCAHNVGPEKSRYREIQGGLKYIYPPAGGVNDLSKVKIPLYKQLDGVSINEKLDNYYSKIQFEMNLKAERARLSAIVQPKLRRVNNSISKISALLSKRDKTDEYKLYGELLTANLYQKKDYQESIDVFDYINNKNITIELDSQKTLNENAQRYFKLYTKSKTTKEKSSKMLEELNMEKEYLENLLYSIQTSTEFDEIKSELEGGKYEGKKGKKSEILKFDIQGFEVYVGRNNKQNDYIVSKLSKDEDYWFHTRLCAGSHVLLKVRDAEPNEEVLFECCKLAREYSSAAQPSKVGVIYTKRKFIKKPPAAPLGYVIYKNEKEVLV